MEGQYHIGLDIQHDAVGLPQNLGKNGAARRDTQGAAQHRSAAGIDQVLVHNLPVGIAQCFQGADLGTFLVDHPGHGGNADQRGDQNEKHRKYPGDARHNIGGAVQIVIANVAVPVQNGQIRRIHGVNLIPGIQQLFLGILQLLFRIRQLFFGVLLCLLVVLPAVLQFFLSFLPFSPANRNFLFRVFKFGFTGPHFLLALIDLRCRIGKLLLCCRLLAFQLRVCRLNRSVRVRDSNHLHGGFIVASSGFQLPGKPIEPGLGLGNLLLDRGFLFLRFGCIISLLQVCQFRARLLHLSGNCLIIPDECLGRAELLRRDICRKLGGLCVQLLFCRRELRFGLCLFLGKLLARDFNLSAGFLDLLSSVFDLFFAVNQLFAVFLQLLFSVFQLLFRIRQLLLRVRLSVFILLYAIQVFLIAIVVFLLGFLLNVQKTLLTQLFRLRLQPVRFRIQKVVIFIGVDSVASIQTQMDLRVIIVVQRRLRHEEIILQRTAANRGCAPVHIHVQGRRHIAHNGKGLLHHLFQGVGVVAV